jgi:hypothetical protein
MKRLSRFAAALAWLVFLATSSTLGAQERGEGPVTLILSYKSPPAQRAAFRDHMERAGVARFAAWKKEGVVADYQILFSSYVNEATWDMLAVLSFARYADLGRWREVERRMPGGLTAEGLALASPVASYACDLTWEGSAETRDPAKAAYVVIPYAYSARAEYKPYAEGYVVPQMKGWIAEGVLSRYSLYLNQHEAGDPWDALFVLEYKDMTALALRRVTVNKVREKLQSNPEWKKLSDVKQGLRTEGQIVIAEPVLAR